MRPGQSCPGVASGRTVAEVPQLRFNEAGAIMPRSGSRPSTRPKPDSSRFNEAGAIMPRSGKRSGAGSMGGRFWLQ